MAQPQPVPVRTTRFQLGSRVGRRIFFLFLVCAVAPLVLATWLAAGVVEHQIERREEERLHLLVKDLAMGVYERLTVLADQLALVGENSSAAVAPVLRFSAAGEGAPSPRSGFLWIARTAGERTVEVFGDVPGDWLQLGLPVPAPDEDRRHRLAFAEEVPGRTRLFLGYAPSAAGAEPTAQPSVVWGEIDRSWLWWGAVGGTTLPNALELVVLDGSGHILETTRPVQGEPVTSWVDGTEPFRSGRLEIGGGEYLAKAWRMSLHALVGSPRLQFVLLEPAASVAAPFSAFLRTIALSLLLALLLIVLFSLVQIRRTLVPLHQLGRAARELSAGRQASPVVIESRDEFREVAQAFNTMAERLQRQFGVLRTGADIHRAILSSLEPTRILEIAVQGIANLVGGSAAAIVLDERGEGGATYVCHSASRGIRRGEMAGAALAEVTAAARLQVNELPPWAAPLRELSPRSLLVAPVAGDRVGLLMAGSSREHAYPLESVAALEELARQVSVALANAALVEELEMLQECTLVVFARTVDLKSRWTSGHSERVAALVRELAVELRLEPGDAELLHRSALVHDIGKIGVPDSILDKAGPLSAEETEIIRSHVRLGVDLLAAVPRYEEVVVVVGQHHEWWNGEGYPRGISGDALHPLARLLSVADVFDALTSPRPYRRELAVEEAIDMLRRQSGTQFEPSTIEPFVRVVSRIEWASSPTDAPALFDARIS